MDERHSRHRRSACGSCHSGSPEDRAAAVLRALFGVEGRRHLAFKDKDGIFARQLDSEELHAVEDVCLPERAGPAACDPGARYRTASGECNNLRHPHYGAANIAMRRCACLPPSSVRMTGRLKTAPPCAG